MGCRNSSKPPPMWLFVLALCISGLTKAIFSAYFTATLTTLEKEFKIRSTHTGLLKSSNDWGYLVIILVASYIGGRVHMPIFIGVSCVIRGAFTFLVLVPHFVYRLPDAVSSDVNTAVDNPNEAFLCNASISYNISDMVNEQATGPNLAAFYIIIVAQIMLGAAGAVISPLGIAYFTTNSSKSASALYSGLMFATFPLGAIGGYAIAAICLKVYVDPSITPDFGEKDPRWIGAWWLGYFLIAPLQILSGVIFFFYPKEMATTDTQLEQVENRADAIHKHIANRDPSFYALAPVESDSEQDTAEDVSASSFLSYVADFFTVLLNVVKNPIYIGLMVAYCANAYSFAGYSVFVLKYIEVHFRKPASEAVMLLAGCGAIAGAIGMCAGGAIVAKFKLGFRAMIRMALVAFLVPIFLMIIKIWFECPSETVYGIHVTNTNDTASCSIRDNCLCNEKAFLPVCNPRTGVSYLTPCILGCTNYTEAKTYENCDCSGNSIDLGFCPVQCKLAYILFIASLALSSLISTSSVGPTITMVSRSVNDKERAVGMATMFMLTTLIGIAPAAIAYGAVVDSTCVYYKASQVCGFYDKALLRTRMHWLTAGLQTLAFLCILFVAILVHRRYDKYADEHKVQNQEEIEKLNKNKTKL